MLKTNSVQTHVNFAGHRVERPVISVRGEAIAGVLKTNAMLTHIDLRLGKIGSEGVKARCLQRVRVSLFFSVHGGDWRSVEDQLHAHQHRPQRQPHRRCGWEGPVGLREVGVAGAALLSHVRRSAKPRRPIPRSSASTSQGTELVWRVERPAGCREVSVAGAEPCSLPGDCQSVEDELDAAVHQPRRERHGVGG